MIRIDRARGVGRCVAAAIALLAFAAVAPAIFGPAHAMDGVILVVSAADGPMPAPELERLVRRALDAASIQYSQTDLAFLTARAASGLPALANGATLRVCTRAGSPCITLLRE